MDFKTTNKGKKSLKNASDSRQLSTFSLSTRDEANLTRLSDALHYSKSSILSALLEKASDPSDPKVFNALANFFTEYEIARGQNVKKNKVSFECPTACPSYASGGDVAQAPVTENEGCAKGSEKLVVQKGSTNSLQSTKIYISSLHNGHYAKLGDDTSFASSNNDTAEILDEQGNAYKVALKGGYVISPSSVPLSVYDVINGQNRRASAEEIRQIAQKLLGKEARVVAEKDDFGILRFTGISMSAAAASGADSEKDGSCDAISDEDFDAMLKSLMHPAESCGKKAS